MIQQFLAKILRTLLLISCKLITGIQARWQSKPEYSSCIYYANHTSHLDGLIIWSCLPKAMRKNVHPIAAKDYWGQTKVKRFISTQIFNAVLINRKPVSQDNPMDVMDNLLSEQHSLILFPEGTRGDGEHIADFKSGLYHLAKNHPNVRIVPVYLNNLNRVLPKGSKLVVPIICSAVFGQAIKPLQKDETKETFLARAKVSLEELAP